MGDLVRMFSSTRASIVVVSYDKWNRKRSSAQEKMFEVFQRLCGGSTKWSALWMTPGVAFAKTARISTGVEKLSISSGTHRFSVVEFQNKESHVSASGPVTLGLAASASDAGAYQDSWLSTVCTAVATERVRFICGVFSRGKEDTEPFFKILRAGEYGLPFQPFWTEEPQDGFNNDEVAAVAAHFNVVAKNTKYVVVYPAYFVALGPSHVRRVTMRDQPDWSDKLFPCGSSIEKGSRALTHVPQLRGGKSEGTFPASLPLLTQKTPPLEKLAKGVHQIVLWVGYSRPSNSSAQRHASRWAAGYWQWERPR